MRYIRFNRNIVAAAHDGVMAAASFVLALYIRLGTDQMYMAADYLRLGAALFTAVCMAVFASLGLYRSLWRYASMQDLVAILRAVSLSVVIFAVLMFIINRLEGVPRSVLFINWMLLLFMLGGPRFIYRAIKDRSLTWRMSLNETPKIPVLLIGAGDAAEQFIRDMQRDARAPYEVVALAGDNPNQKGGTIHRVPIYDMARGLHGVVETLEHRGRRPQKIILSDDRLAGPAVRHLLDSAEQLGIPLARLPRLSEFKTGVSETLEIRPIALEDLLGRPQNVLDRDSMRRFAHGRRVLVTGAGGTIGGELTRQIAASQPSELILAELCEFNLYQIERELRGAYPNLTLIPILCDVRDEKHIDTIFTKHAPELVFHAAAIKHVPLAEGNIEETVLTNVLGTQNVAQACRAHKAGVMVMISTDKAVNPTNVMGASKRLAESICQALGAEKNGPTKFITVRFGNVLGSSGSVVPLFQEQLRKGGPLTVTHAEMTRYFMSVREAVELVLQAAVLGAASERQESIFVLDMGQPVRILDLALQMIRLAGLRPYEDIKIAYTGLRPGEKLYEELFHFSENAAKTAHESIYLASPRFADMAQLARPLETLLTAAHARKAETALECLKRLVPEFQPSNA